MKRPVQGTPQDAEGPLGPDDGQFMLAYPTVYEYLTEDKWDDGKRRQTSTLLLMAQEGMWKASLKDREYERSAWVSGATLVDLWANLEEGLSTGKIEWRKDRPYQPRKKS